MDAKPPRRIPPWRRRDAEPGPITVMLLISIGVLAVLAMMGWVR